MVIVYFDINKLLTLLYLRAGRQEQFLEVFTLLPPKSFNGSYKFSLPDLAPAPSKKGLAPSLLAPSSPTLIRILKSRK